MQTLGMRTPIVRSLLAVLISLVVLTPLARAQGYSPADLLQARKKALEQRSQGSNVGHPQMSTDFLTALQTLGIRPGMTLREAKAAAEKWGAYVTSGAPTDLQLARQYLTRDSPNASGGSSYFQFSTAATANYRGAGQIFIAGEERSSMAGAVQFHVYPLEPFGDIQDPDKLIVYFIKTDLQGGDEGQISEAEFVRRGAPLVGGTLIPRTSPRVNRKLCEFANRHAEMAFGFSQSIDLPPENQPSAWATCGDTTVVQCNGKDAKGLVRGYSVVRFDMCLARKAFEAFHQYGSDYRAGVYAARGQPSP